MHHVVTGPAGHKFHLGGRHRPKPHKTKSVRRYMTAPLPVAPDSFSYFATNLGAEHDILGNDTLGDCTAAGACHLAEAFTGAAGDPVVLTVADAIKFYSLSTGYNPSDPSTDHGGDEVTVCNTWRDQGLDGAGAHKIAGYIAIDPTDAALVKSCCWLFGGLYFGIECDDSFTQISGDGFTWGTGTPDPNNGHCVVGAGATPSGVLINTWGMIGTFTWAAVAQFCADSAGGNLFAILSRELIASAQAKAPSGFDFAALVADFDGLGGAIAASA